MTNHRPASTTLTLAWTCFLVATGGILLAVAPSTSAAAEDREEAFHIEHDEAEQISRITFPATNNTVAWNDVLRGLAQVSGLDDDALRDMIPQGTIDITATGNHLTFMAINVVTAPAIELQVLPASEDREDAALLITVDHRKLEESRRAWKADLREVFGDRDESKYGLRLSRDWEDAEAEQRITLVVHGLNSTPEQVIGLSAAIGHESTPWGVYAYPNDQPLADSADRLSRDLKHFATKYPKRRFAIVAHSMGGLIVRAAVENPELDPGNVDRLIMVATPTHGSQMARMSFGSADIWEHGLLPGGGGPVARLQAAIGDGLAEADHDLRPDSIFLKTLNARERNASIKYSLFLGTAGPMTEEQLASLRERLKTMTASHRTLQLVWPKIETILADFDEVLVGKGDGVVAVKRGRLEGVDDTVLLPFTHVGPTDKNVTPGDRRLYAAIRERLEK